MAGEIVSIEEQLARFREGYAVQLRLKARGLDIPVRLLTAEEQAKSESNARKEFFSRPEEDRGDSLFLALTRKHLLFEAAKDASGIPGLPMRMLEGLAWDEQAFLFDELMSQYDKVNPRLDSITDEQLEGWIADAKKNPSSLNELSFMQLHRLVPALLARIPDSD